MRTIEEGKNLEGLPCWFILEDANLVGVYDTLEEAENNL
tara:strand:+ start:881 stop:997 length:117 start_codon:yes stop_codon:yes gene_type:complete